MTGTGNNKLFAISELVESVFDAGTIYRVSKLHPPTHSGDFSTYISVELVRAGKDTFQYGVSDRKGRMADGCSYAPYHFQPATTKQQTEEELRCRNY